MPIRLDLLVLVDIDDRGQRLLTLEEVLVTQRPARATGCGSGCGRRTTGSGRGGLLVGPSSGGGLVAPVVGIVLGVGAGGVRVRHLDSDTAGEDGGHVRLALGGGRAGARAVGGGLAVLRVFAVAVSVRLLRVLDRGSVLHASEVDT